MKMLIRLILALSVSLCLIGCKKDETASSATAPSALTLGVAFETLQTEYWVAGYEAIKAEAAKRGFQVVEAVADGDANRQFEQVRNFVTRKVDGIILVPKDAKTCIPMIRAANAANSSSELCCLCT